MSKAKATRTSTDKYYLYNPSTGVRHEARYPTFDTACDAAKRLRGIWEVHVINDNRKRK